MIRFAYEFLWRTIFCIGRTPVGKFIPIPKFTLRFLPKKYKLSLANNFLDIAEETDSMPEIVQIVLDKIEEKGYDMIAGKKYDSTDEEIDEVLEKIPQLKSYRIYFHRWCERKRKEAGLHT